MEKKAKIHYFSLTDEQTKTEKLEWFKETKFQDIDFEQIKPDKTHNWINQTDNDFDSLIPVCNKETKIGKGGNAIFELFTNGVASNRDEWVYDITKQYLKEKVNYFIQIFNKQIDKGIYTDDKLDLSIKWSRDLKKILKRGKKINYDEKYLHKDIYRPYIALWYYYEKNLSDLLTSNHFKIFGELGEILSNKVIMFSGVSHSKPFQTLATNSIYSLDTLEKTQGLPLYRYEKGVCVENITDWALELFQRHYEKITSALEITSFEKDVISGTIEKLDIFHYVYAVLHQPEYRQKYEQNLKREFPRVPLYADFWKYAAAGEKLMDLHLHYESPQKITSLKRDVIFTPLQRKDIDLEVFKASKAGKKKKTGDTDKEVSKVASTFTVYPILKIRDGNIEIDELTTLLNVPAQALAYKLGNRSAIEWILDQYKPYKSDDKTIQEKFNTYNFAEYKEQVIDLLQKVCWVSMETMKIVGEL